MKTENFIWINNSLDGIGSSLFLKWFIGSEQTTRISSYQNFKEDFLKFANTHKKYKRVWIIGLPTYEYANIVDLDNVIIIDSTQNHFDNKDSYTKCKKIIENNTSCVRVLEDKFGTDKVNDNQKKFCDLVNDYAAFTYNDRNCLHLNTIFYQTAFRDRVRLFHKQFENGLTDYTNQQKNMILLYEQQFKNVYTNLNFWTYIKEKSGGKQTKIVSTMTSSHINEVANLMIKEHKADIGIVVNVEKGKVSFRRSKTSNVNLQILAQKLCNGNGHVYASGGDLTDRFEEFSKKFNLM